MNELVALLDGREVGRIRQRRGRLSFAYAPSWRDADGAYPISLSMPLAQTEHQHAAIEPFLWGLLPDNELVLERWAQKFQVSPRNAFGLIAEVGEDCAGAVQFLTPERIERQQEQQSPQIQWLSDADIAARMRALKADASAMRAPRDLGQFSLAGAQPKTALLFDGKRWGVPSGRMPTTHIVKPTTADFDGHAENEHFCLSLARRLGLPTATTEVRQFEEVTAIVVTRYDRVDTKALAAAAATRVASAAAQVALHESEATADSSVKAAKAISDMMSAAADAEILGKFSKSTPIYRVHQEDTCQSLGVHPARKYQNEGGPGPSAIIDLLRANAGGANASVVQEDIDTFIKALIFNWLIGGSDAHAKNYSILIGGRGIARLAPLYDIASIYPYPHIDPLKAKLAMKIGSAYKLRDIGWKEWRLFAAEVRLSADYVVNAARTMAQQLTVAIDSEHARAIQNGLKHSVIERLTAALNQRAKTILAISG